MKQVTYSQDALKTLGRMPVNTAKRIRSKMDQYVADPSSLTNNAKMLTGMAGYLRLRVGGWRVIFSESGDVVAVVRVASRGGAYD